MTDLNGKHLTLTFTLTETGVNTEIAGNKCGIWVDVLKHVMPNVYKELSDTDGSLEQAQERLIESMAELAGKSVDDVKKELAEMDGDTKANVAKLSLQYLLDFISKKSEENIEAATASKTDSTTAKSEPTHVEATEKDSQDAKVEK